MTPNARREAHRPERQRRRHHPGTGGWTARRPSSADPTITSKRHTPVLAQTCSVAPDGALKKVLDPLVAVEAMSV
jgi:hypothetical protein